METIIKRKVCQRNEKNVIKNLKVKDKIKLGNQNASRANTCLIMQYI